MKKYKLSRLRSVTISVGILVTVGATIAGNGVGTYCTICPVGFLQVSAASRSIPVHMIPGVLIGLVLVYILGSFFCAWLCTTSLIRTIFSRNTRSGNRKASLRYSEYFPFLLLFVAVAASFWVKFPIFCLVCPIGLFFGFVYAVFRLLVIFDPSWNLIIFPAIIVVEVLVFRKWCSYLCPIAAVFKLISGIPGLKVRLKVNPTSCLLSQEKHCQICAKVCPETVEIVKHDKTYLKKCTSCMVCKDHCPTGSISFSNK